VSTPPAAGGTRAPRHVLVAEDNALNRKLAATILEQLGYRVSTVADGAEALEFVRSKAPDLVLMDVQMPVMDGAQAARAIRAYERKCGKAMRGRRLPIVALTAGGSDVERDACLAAGMDAFLAKPFRARELAALVAGLLATAENALPAEARESCAPPAGKASASLPGINLRAALERMGGDAQTFLRFAAALPAELAEATAAVGTLAARGEEAPLTSDEAASLRKLAHRIKGSFGSVGAERLEAACAAIGNAAALSVAARAEARGQGAADCAALVRELHAALVEVAPLLADILERPQMHGLAVEARAAAASLPR
jgi:CheY-like chemotaxis protein